MSVHVHDAAIDIAELSEFYIKIIPSAAFLFDVTKLKLSRNNVRAFSQGFSSVIESLFFLELGLIF